MSKPPSWRDRSMDIALLVIMFAATGCTMAGDENGEGWCESEVEGVPRFDRDVITEQNNMNHCVGVYPGWFCEDYITTNRCMIMLRCEWNHQTDTCEQMAVPAGYISGSEVRVPVNCDDLETGMP